LTLWTSEGRHEAEAVTRTMAAHDTSIDAVLKFQHRQTLPTAPSHWPSARMILRHQWISDRPLSGVSGNCSNKME
jgi:hypothetical protein